MKKLTFASLALLVAFTIGSAMAGEKSSNSLEPAAFQALSKLSAPGQMALNKMTDQQLAVVEGADVEAEDFSITFGDLTNAASNEQANVCECNGVSGGVTQLNASEITQRIQVRFLND